MYSYFRIRLTTFGGINDTPRAVMSMGGLAVWPEGGVTPAHVRAVPVAMEADENTAISSDAEPVG